MRLDIVIPAHNEEARIDRTLGGYCRRCPPDVRFLVALDGCTDRTREIAEGYGARDPRVRVLPFPKLGKGGVIMEALRHCDGELAAFVDADMATPPRELLRLADVVSRGADGAIACRRHPAAVLPAGRPLARRLASAAFAWVVRWAFRLPYRDTQCGAKVFRREAVERLLPVLSSRDFLFDVDLLAAARDLGFHLVEVPTVWIERRGSRLRLVREAERTLASVLRLWLHRRVLPPAEAARPYPPPRAPGPVPLHAAARRPDLALVAPYPPEGVRHGGSSGVASYTANLARALAAEGAEVVVVAPLEPAEPVERRDGPLTILRAFGPGPGALSTAVRAAVAAGAPVVHLQHELFLYGGPEQVLGIVPALLHLRRTGRGSVVTMHQVVDPREVDRGFARLHRIRAPAPLARVGVAAVQRTVRRLADVVLVHEPAFADLVPGAVVVPHGVEEAGPADRAEARRTLGLDSRLTALTFGFLAPYKGLEVALEASRLASDEVSLVVAGGEHPRLRGRDGYAEQLRARWAGAARFTGSVPDADVPKWFAAADVALFLYPRPHASSGALALALAHGTPFLLSPALARTTGAPATLTVPLDPGAVARRLRGLAADPARLEELRADVARLARGRSWSEVARRHLAVYEEVMRARRAPGRGLRTG